MVFSEIDSFFNLLEKIKRAFKKPDQKETVATRFVQIFENHNVHRNQIPSFFGHGLTVSNLVKDETLLPLLSEEILNEACELFAVKREWLDGVEKQIYPTHDFYKEPEEFSKFILNLKAKTTSRLHGMLFVSDSQTKDNDDAIIILKEVIGVVGEKPIYRFHICNNWFFNYWKSRVYLTACIASAWKNNIYIHGRKIKHDILKRYLYGEQFLGLSYSDLTNVSTKWYPEDMALRSDAFFDGLKKSLFEGEYEKALRLWSELRDKGQLDTGINGSTKVNKEEG